MPLPLAGDGAGAFPLPHGAGAGGAPLPLTGGALFAGYAVFYKFTPSKVTELTLGGLSSGVSGIYGVFEFILAYESSST